MLSRTGLISIVLTISLSCGGDDPATESAEEETVANQESTASEEEVVNAVSQAESAPEIPAEGEIDQGSVIFTLDLVAEEGLVAVYHARQQTHETAAYEISTLNGHDLWFGGGRTTDAQAFKKVVQYNEGSRRYPQWVPAIRFLGNTDDRIIARVETDSGVALLTGKAGTFNISDSYDWISNGTQFGVYGEKIAYVGHLKTGMQQLILFDGSQFTMGPMGKKLRSLEPTPDNATVMYQLDKTYGVGVNLYTKKPQWAQIGPSGPWAYLGVESSGSAVYIDYQADNSFDSISTYGLDPSGKRLRYQGTSEQGVQLISESRQPGETPRAVYGPYEKIISSRGRIETHSQTGLPYFVTQSEDGQRLVVGESGNSFKASDAFAKVTVQESKKHISSGPVAVANSDTGVQVLSGAKAGPVHDKITSLQVAENGASVLYIGLAEQGQRVVMADQPHDWFTSISELQQTTESGFPTYLGTKEDGMVAVLNGKSSSTYPKIARPKIRPGDSMAWLATFEGGNVVGIGTQSGKTYESIKSIQIAHGHLWYDATKEERIHRVLETTESTGFTSIGSAQFTESSGTLVYSARLATTATRTEPSGDDDKPDKVIEQAVLVDHVIKGTETLGTHSRTMDLDSNAKKLMAGKDLIDINLVSSTDHFFYVANSDQGITVGFDTQAHGPFDEIKELKLRPAKDNLVWFARKGEKWAVQNGSNRGQDLDSVTKLRFGGVGAQHIRYEGSLGENNMTFVDSEQYMSIKEEKLNRNNDLYTYQGQRKEGWHLVVDGNHSSAYSAMDKTAFTQNGYGVEVPATTESDSMELLRKVYGQNYTALQSHDWVGPSTQYLKPLVSGHRLTIEEDSFVLKSKSESIITPSLSGNTQYVVAIGNSISSIKNAWLVQSLEGSKIKLKSAPNERSLRNAQGRYSNVWIVPLENHFSYPIKVEGKSKRVLNGNVYTSVDGFKARGKWFYTENGNFMAIGRGDTDHLIINNGRTNGYQKIRGLVWPGGSDSSGNSADVVAMKVDSTDSLYGWVITNQSTNTRELGMVEKLSSTTPQWTALSSTAQHTLIWKGDAGKGMKTWVGSEWYDGLANDPQITTTKGILSYTGKRDNRLSVYFDGKHGDWFSGIRQLSFSGPGDSPVYIGIHTYLKSNNRVAWHNGQAKQLMAVIHGTEQGPWVDNIQNLIAGDSLSATSYTAKVDGMWQAYLGAQPQGESFREIAWLTRVTSDANSTPSLHFLGRLDDGWVEVHNGARGVKVDAILDLPLNAGVSSMRSLSRSSNGREDGKVLVDDQGRFDYLAVVDGKQAMVHRGAKQSSFSMVDRLQYFKDGEVIVYRGTSNEGIHLVVNGVKSPAYKSLSDGPIYSSSNGKVHAIMKLASSQLAERAENEPKDPYPNRYALLYGTEEVTRMHSHGSFQTLPNDAGVGMTMQKGEKWHVYVNGELGPAFVKTSNVVWRDSLKATRYIGVEAANILGQNPEYIAGKEKVAGPFRKVKVMDQATVEDETAIFWIGQTSAHDQLWINDELTNEGEKIIGLYWHGSTAVVDMVDENTSESQLKDTSVDKITSLPNALGSRLLTVFNRGKTSLMLSSSQSDPSWIVYDLKISDDGLGTAAISWIATSIDRAKGTLSLTPTTMSVKTSELKDIVVGYYEK